MRLTVCPLRLQALLKAEQLGLFGAGPRQTVQVRAHVRHTASGKLAAVKAHTADVRAAAAGPAAMSRAEAITAIREGVTDRVLAGWYRNADSSYKRHIVAAVHDDPAVKTAALNILHQEYTAFTGTNVPFERFLDTPIQLYRGGKAHPTTGANSFTSYSYDPKEAAKFAAKKGMDGTHSITVRPRDTLGMLSTTPEGEVLVPPSAFPPAAAEPVRGTPSARDIEVAERVIDPVRGEHAHILATQTLRDVHQKLAKWDAERSYTRLDRKAATAELDAIFDEADQAIDQADGVDEIHTHYGIRFETQAASILEQAHQVMSRAIERRKTMLSTYTAAEYKRFSTELRSESRGLLVRDHGHEFGSDPRFIAHNEYTWTSDKIEEMRADMAQELADVGTLPAAHHALFRSSGTTVRNLAHGGAGSLERAAFAGIEEGTAIPLVTMLRGGVMMDRETRAENNATLIHELGHIVDNVVGRRLYSAGSSAVARLRDRWAEHLASSGVDARVAARDRPGWDEGERMRGWRLEPAEALAEAYRYVYADGGDLRTHVKAADLGELAQHRAWFDAQVKEATGLSDLPPPR